MKIKDLREAYDALTSAELVKMWDLHGYVVVGFREVKNKCTR